MSKRKVISNHNFELMFYGNDPIEDYEVIDLKIDCRNKHVIRAQKNITNCVFKGKTEFQNMVISPPLVIPIIFRNCTFTHNNGDDDHLSFENIKGGRLFIEEDCNVQVKLYVMKCSFKTLEIRAQNCDHIQINAPKIDGIHIQGHPDRKMNLKSLTVSGPTNFGITNRPDKGYRFINCRDVKMTGNISFHFTPPQSIFIGNGEYQWIQFHNSKDIENLTVASDSRDHKDLTIEKLDMPYISLSGKVFVSFASIKDILMPYLVNLSGSIRFLGGRISKKMIITDAEVANFKLNDVDLSQAKMVFERSNLDGLSCSNVKWNKDYLIYAEDEAYDKTIKEENWVSVNQAKKETYRQLKQLNKSQGNKIDALNFYRNEMNAYWESIRKSKTVRWTDRTLIGINRLVSDFGQNWVRPLLLIFGVNLFFFSLMLLANYKNLHFACSIEEMSSTAFSKSVGEFFYLINPAHKFTAEYGGLLTFLDFTNRIIIGFLIYHFIKATRRYATI